MNFRVCKASSRVGERIRARAPAFAFRVFSFSNKGMRKQAVFPLPVRAMATTSRPVNATGIVWNEKFEAFRELALLRFIISNAVNELMVIQVILM